LQPAWRRAPDKEVPAAAKCKASYITISDDTVDSNPGNSPGLHDTAKALGCEPVGQIGAAALLVEKTER
jgi:hypothetical protein